MTLGPKYIPDVRHLCVFLSEHMSQKTCLSRSIGAAAAAAHAPVPQSVWRRRVINAINEILRSNLTGF